MEARSRSSFPPAAAGALLATTTGASVGVGTLIGWAAGSWTFGALGGAVAGIPLGVLAVYLRYRDALS